MAITKKKDLTFLEHTYIPQVVKGLGLTFKQIFRPKFTMQYPEERWVPPASYRGRPVLVQEDDGSERCVACGLCSRVCPALAIEVQAGEKKKKKERYPEKFEINMVLRYLLTLFYVSADDNSDCSSISS